MSYVGITDSDSVRVAYVIDEFATEPLSQEIVDAVFATPEFVPHPLSSERRVAQERERFEEAVAETAGWERAVLITYRPSIGTTSWRQRYFVENRWRSGGHDLPEKLENYGEEFTRGLAADAYPVNLVLAADRATRTVRHFAFTGPAGHKWNWWSLVDDDPEFVLGTLFGDDVQPAERDDWLQLDIEHQGLAGRIARRHGSPERLIVVDEVPDPRGGLRVVAEATPGDEPQWVEVSELEVAGIYPIEHETGTCGDEFVGSWRMRTWQYSEIELESGDGGDDWLDGRNVDGRLRPSSDAAPVSVPGEVILTIRPDATFFELLTPDTGIEILDVADGHIGSPFHGYLDIVDDIVDGRTYVFAHELERGGARNEARYDLDPEIVEELHLDGDTLTRVQNMVHDGLYATRYVMVYDRTSSPLP